MSETDTIYLRAGDTEPISMTVSAGGLESLDDLAEARLYAWLKDEETNHVDGVLLTVEDSATRRVSFDPRDAKNGGGNAFDVEGVYLCHIELLMTDGGRSQHPGNRDLKIVVRASRIGA